MNKDNLLNIERKNVKKPLIYGAIAFLVFIISILGFAIYDNTSSKQDNLVLPPQIKKETILKENNTNKPKQEIFNKEKKITFNDNTSIQSEQESKNQEIDTYQLEYQQKFNKKLQQNNQENDIINKTEIKNIPTTQIVKYYIQVAALMKYKKPNRKFLQLLKKEGYNYKMHETYYVKNGKKIEVIKILVGPFSKSEVKKELKKIKAKITQNAFIYKVK